MTRTEVMRVRRLIDRRTFLQAATGCVAVPWLASTTSTAIASETAAIPQCLVGFIEHGDSGVPSLPDIASTQQRITPAEQIAEGDPRLDAQGVRLHFRGIHFADDRASSELNSLMLDLEMQVMDAEVDSIPWHFWTYSKREVLNVSGEVIARVPLRDDGSLIFTMTMQSGLRSPSEYQIKLTTGTERGVPKLRLGTYVIAVPNGDCEIEKQSFSASPACLTFTIADVNQTVQGFA